MENMKKILVLLIVLIADVESFACGYLIYGEQPHQNFGQ